MSMQVQIIASLQVASRKEDAILDLTSLYDAALTNRHDTVRSLTDLSQRVIASLHLPRQPVELDNGMVMPRHWSMDTASSHRTTSDLLPSGRTLSEESGSRRLSVSRLFSTRSNASGIQRGTSRASLASFSYKLPQIQRHDNDIMTLRGFRMHDDDDDDDEDEDERELDKMSKLSLHDSARGSYSKPCIEQEPSAKQCQTAINTDRASDRALSVSSSNATSSSGIAPDSEPTLSQQTSPQLAVEIPHFTDDARSMSAPEVVTPETASMLVNRRESMPAQHSAGGSYPRELTWADSSLGRPNRSNGYWGFCKGAWDIHDGIQKGLSLQTVPNGLTQSTCHWKCKHCEFRSKPTNQTRDFPDTIFYNPCGIRYRWLFLAKSHSSAKNVTAKPDAYNYGCIFCAAEGRPSATYGSLDTLLISHIATKHKVKNITPEVLSRTKCIVGRLAEKNEEWDVNIPQMKYNSVSSVNNAYGM